MSDFAGENDFVSTARTEIARVLHDQGIPEPAAVPLAARIVEAIQHRTGGCGVYLPRPKRYDPAAVVRDFTGDNHAEVCRRHGIHRATLYRVLKRAQRERRSLSCAQLHGAE